MIVSADGFKRAAVNNLIATVAHTTSVKINLHLGSNAESVTVESEGEQLDATTSDISTLIAPSDIQQHRIHGPGHKEAIIEARPFTESKPRYANDATFFSNIVIILGEAFYDLSDATNLRFDSNCIIGIVENPPAEPELIAVKKDVLPTLTPSTSWHGLSAHNAQQGFAVPPPTTSYDRQGKTSWELPCTS